MCPSVTSVLLNQLSSYTKAICSSYDKPNFNVQSVYRYHGELTLSYNDG